MLPVLAVSEVRGLQFPGDVRRRLSLLVCLIATCTLVACSRSSSSPTGPTPPEEPPPPATYVLSGTVTIEPDGTALAGARVEIIEGEGTGRSAITTHEGKYELGELKAGPYVIQAAAEGFEPEATPVTVSESRALDFALAAVVTPDPPSDPEEPAPPAPDHVRLSGAVVDDETGEALADAQIEITSGPNAGQSTRSGADGRYAFAALDPGALALSVTREGYTPGTTSNTIQADTELVLRLVRIQPPGDPPLRGLVVDVFSGEPLAGITVAITDGGEATSGQDGIFAVAPSPDGQINRGLFRSPAIVDRETVLDGSDPARPVTLIPSSFDLKSFDEMFRSRGGLHRWITPPRLHIERRALTFTNVTDMEYAAGDSLMSEEEARALVADLEWTLPQLTGGTFTTFASVDITAAEPGDVLAIGEPGTILVARFDGLNAAIGAWGYGRWAWNAAGEVQSGIAMLDATFDAEAGQFRRSLRAHELGHALGTDHVSSMTSVMHVSARIEPTAFDRNAGVLAFERPTLNRWPDIDPEPSTLSYVRGGLMWTGDR